MTHERQKTPSAWAEPLRGPAAVMCGAVFASLLALALGKFAPDFLVPLRVVLIVGALVAAGMVVWWRLCDLGEQTFEARAWTAGFVVVGAALIFCAREAMDESWDSLRMALGVFSAVAAGGAVIVLLPSIGRRIAVTLLLLFHFGGILTAVTAVAPHNGAAPPYLPTAIWSLVYRNYLQFAYMNNAYHFYSPEPGPPTLVWFRVEFEDGSVYWYKLAEHGQFSTRLQYQRMLALTESTNQPGPGIHPERLALLYLSRSSAGDRLGIETPSLQDASNHYRETSDLTKVYLPSYVRHVVWTVREKAGKQDVPVASVHVYRLAHNIISAPQLKAGVEPDDKSFYTAFFLGVYTEDGKLLDDPFTNWMLPIYRKPLRQDFDLRNWKRDSELIDMLEKHIQSLNRKRSKGNGQGQRPGA